MLQTQTQICRGCRRTVPANWAIPFTGMFARDARGEIRGLTRVNGGVEHFVECNACFDRPIPAFWGGRLVL